jgi:ATP-binding cassette subfamily B protein
MSQPDPFFEVKFYNIIIFLWKVCALKWSHAIFLVICPALWSIESTWLPYIIGQFIDRLHPNVRFSEIQGSLWRFILAICLVTAGYRFFNYIIGIKLIPSLRSRLSCFGLSRILDRPYIALKQHLPGELSAKISDLTSTVPELLEMFSYNICTPSIVLTLGLIMLSRADIMFALITFAWSFIFIAANILMTPYLGEQSAQYARRGNRVLGVIADTVLNSLSVKLHNSEQREDAYLYEQCKPAESAERTLQWSFFFLNLGVAFLYIVMLTFSLYLGFHRYCSGDISLGVLSSILYLNLTVAHVLWESVSDFNRISRYLGRVKQSLATLFSHPNAEEKAASTQGQILHLTKAPSIFFENLHFGYTPRHTLFQKLTLRIEPGQKVGLVGYSGAGKTSLIQLLLRFYSATSGNIFINTIPLQDITPASLYHHITFIPQNPYYFRRSLWDNLVYGSTNASQAAVDEACNRAGLMSVIRALPEGYDTILSEQGAPLSGGEKQRLSIAKAFLRNTPILILDEITSQLDAISEENIQTTLYQLMEHKTCIVIAHRLRTVVEMDTLIVMDKGNIVQQGTHLELVGHPGLYRDFWNAQSRIS